VGFTDSAHFSRAFKKQFEQSPKDFRAMALMAGR
jgi:AraC-like DNA-binding protein